MARARIQAGSVLSIPESSRWMERTRTALVCLPCAGNYGTYKRFFAVLRTDGREGVVWQLGVESTEV